MVMPISFVVAVMAVAVFFPMRSFVNVPTMRRVAPVALPPHPVAAAEIIVPAHPDIIRAGSNADRTIVGFWRRRTNDHSAAIIAAATTRQSARAQQNSG